MGFYREIEDVVDALNRAKKERINVNLLIGSGCSVSANIPTANGFVEQIKKRYPREYRRTLLKDYASCMSKLTVNERRNLIAEYVNNAEINWAHLSIAQLLKHKYFNRVLTTNFDNLLLRACAIVDEFPGVYDLATSTNFRPDLLFDKSILHLHGQYTGFILCNTQEEVESQKNNLESVFNELKQKSLWIIVGYSGQNDALLQLLSNVESFEHRLFWVGHNNSEPTGILKEKILGEDKYAFYVKGYDADSFFISLTKSLNCFPPKLIEKPFSYLKDKLTALSEYQQKDDPVFFSTDCIDISTRNIIQEAVDYFEDDKALMANHYLKLGMLNKFVSLIEGCNYEEKVTLQKNFKDLINTIHKNASDYIDKFDNNSNQDVRILINLGDAYNFLTFASDSERSIEYLKNSISKYEKASEIYGFNEEILNKWAESLISLSRLLSDSQESLRYLSCAESKFDEILKANHQKIDVLLRWSDILLLMAEISIDNPDDIQLYTNKSIEKLKMAYEIDKTDAKILLNWGSLLIQMTLLCECDCERLINEAREKFDLAHNIDLKNTYTLLYEADCLFDLANRNINEEILGPLLKQASENYRLAYSTNIENSSILISWAERLADLIDESDEITTLKEILRIFIEALDVYIDDIEDKAKDDLISMMNTIAYRLIEKNDFIFSKQFLDLCLDYEGNEFYQFATLGFWFFRNPEIEINEAEKNGIELYEQCIEISKQKNIGVQGAIEQKLNFEYAKFNYDRAKNSDIAREYCIKALKYGIIYGYERYYEEIMEFSNFLGINDDVAITLS